jgi:hypothetical protein
MKLNLKKIVLCSMWLALYSCMPTDHDELNKSAVETIDVSNIEKLKIEGFPLSDVKYIPLETKEGCLIGRVSKLLIRNNKIFVFDEMYAKALYVFDMGGKFLFQVGGQGEGPSEYVKIGSFDVDSSCNIYINDQVRKKILKFNEKGIFLDYFQYPIFIKQFAYLDKDRFVLSREHNIDKFSKKQNEKNTLLIWNFKKGKMENSYFPFLGDNVEIYGGGTRICRSGNKINFILSCQDIVYSITKHGIQTNYQIDLNQKRIPNEELNSLNHNQVLGSYKEGKFGLNMYKFYENKNFFAFMLPPTKSQHHHYYCLYSKETGKVFVSEALVKGMEKRNFLGQLEVYGTYYDYFINVIQCEALIAYINDARENNEFFMKKYGHLDVVDTLKHMKDESNPIIALYKIKDIE